MIYSFSRKLESSQLNYSVTDKELLALVKGIEHFRHFLIGKEFTVETDHKALEYLWQSKDQNTRLLRWSLKLQEYSFVPKYIRGEENAADGLSRYSETDSKLLSSIEIAKDDAKKEIIQFYHLLLGHGSVNNMKFSLRNKYMWQGMFKDIDKLYKECFICNKSGGPRTNTKNRVFDIKEPNEHWEIDTIGRIPSKDGRNKFILIVIDGYTKYIETKIINTGFCVLFRFCCIQFRFCCIQFRQKIKIKIH
jgi:hypothetical protein